MNTNIAEEDHSADVIPFKPSKAEPPSNDWLRTIELGKWFLSKGIANKSGWLDSFGVSMITPEAVMLASRNNNGFLEFNWTDSQDFSKFNKFVALLPTPEGIPDEEAGEGEEDG